MTKSSVNWPFAVAQAADYLHRAYAELERIAPGAPIDLTAAYGDLIGFKPRRASCAKADG